VSEIVGYGASGGAVFSTCRRWRYALWRDFGPLRQPGEVGASGYPLFIMLNPSTADASQDDPTIRRCIGYAKRWGYGGVTICNLFAWRSPYPQELLGVADPVGDANDKQILENATQALQGSAPIIAAWGDAGTGRLRTLIRTQAAHVATLLSLSSIQLQCLATCDSGAPRHPLYLASDLELRPWWPTETP